jgi:hypothetical protein
MQVVVPKVQALAFPSYQIRERLLRHLLLEVLVQYSSLAEAGFG